jgi:hypothetical protein
MTGLSLGGVLKMAFDPSIDNFDPEPLNVDEFGLGDADRKALSDILMSKGPRAAKEALEKHFGASLADIHREVEESKRYEARVEKMTEALAKFQLHFHLWKNTERNQKTLLAFLEENGLKEFNYRVLAAMYEELAGVDGALDLHETQAPASRCYVGQITPGVEFDSDSGYMPRKLISQMTALEFANAIVRSPAFRKKIDGGD